MQARPYNYYYISGDNLALMAEDEEELNKETDPEETDDDAGSLFDVRG
jgi:hypothetical protein